MDGKVAFVTGSTSGIGLGIARTFAKRGFSIVLSGFGDTELIESIKDELTCNSGVNVHYVSGDLSKLSDIEKLCHDVTKLYPEGIDVLVNCAGFNHVCNVESYPTEQWDAMIGVMLTAPFHLSKYFIPSMKKKGWGRIVNISSTHGMISSPGKAVYSAAKHGIIGLTKGVALETAENGITCNAVCPTFVYTSLLDVQIQSNAKRKGESVEEAKKEFADMVPTKKLIEIDKVAETVAFLCSDAASAITGTTITIDGGYTAQ